VFGDTVNVCARLAGLAAGNGDHVLRYRLENRKP
jgi:class 3 adenylate cyclase